MASSMLLSLTSCDLFKGLINQTEKPTVPTATESEETTTNSTVTGKAGATATPKPAKKPSSIPKGWSKVKQVYGKKYNGKYVYVIMKNYQYKGWYNGKWIKLYDDSYTVSDDENGHVEGVILYRDKNEKYKYCEFKEKR